LLKFTINEENAAGKIGDFHGKEQNSSGRLDTNYNKPIIYKENTVQEEKKLKLPSRLESVEKAAQEIDAFAREIGFDDEAIFAIDMAARESVANAVKHGNLLDETKAVEITLSNAPNGFEIVIRDFGAGFAVDEIADPTDPENLLKASGRGILFMRTFMDEVEWVNHDEGGTMVKMLKRR
jgi:serine/threonine-protein kinase RsbW